VPNEGWLANFAPKLVAMATSLKGSKKGVISIIDDQNLPFGGKNRENRSKRSRDNWSPRNYLKRKQINASKTYSPPASLWGGLN